MKKLAIISTHPIQYYAPLFRALTQRGRITVKVFYTWGEAARNNVYDPGFGKERSWDIPLLDGYDYKFVENTAERPGSSHFKGIINPGLIKDIETYQPNALLVFGWAFQSHLKVLRHFHGKVPILFRGDSTLLDEPNGFSMMKLARRAFLTWVYRHIDQALYVGTNNKAYYKAHGVANKKLTYAPHAIDNDRFMSDDEVNRQKAAGWKQQLGIPNDVLTVLFAGKLEPKKNPDFMVEAAKALPELHFIVAGNGILENELKQKIKGLNNITWLPFQNQSQMPVLYRLADVFVLPSQGPGETWGLAINEAMACGCIIIGSSKCGGAVDLIEDGKNGYMIEPCSHALINALQQIVNNATLQANGGAASRQIIRSFSFTRICEAVESSLHD